MVMPKRSRGQSGISVRRVAKAGLSITDEVRYVIGRAAARDARVVILGQVAFFSTDTGDAWMLDPEDGAALCLAHDGDALPINMAETADQFAVEWTHSYRIDGDLMTVVDRSGRSRLVIGCPAARIDRLLRRMRPGGGP